MEDALAHFQEEENERFTFLSCRQYLKDKPKWLANGVPKIKEAKKAAVKKEDIACEDYLQPTWAKSLKSIAVV